MSDWIGTIFSAWTVVVAVLFVVIVLWAWSSRRKQDFDEAARLPLEADDDSSAR
ncbi:MAG: CcoQ/FixQ family Cbb3-type cytochrome c oxidase assembly chaperone [Gammaproteobacteria bacterium]|nr:CcoQ/FixQ family Cbb3-type cytochrome c oxidase assembly chaperone [Gammaproteobacteria bacterium]MBI5616287.1 CcoQ/FixQ family Cbb3-type cytochrome c oxidase assembly chaperone [Gammaproteobacteria bacterium]